MLARDRNADPAVTAATAAGLAALLFGRPVRGMEGRLALEVVDVGHEATLVAQLGHQKGARGLRRRGAESREMQPITAAWNPAHFHLQLPGHRT